jgi:transposase
MLSLPPTVRLFIAKGSTDMRKSFDGLAGLVRSYLEDDPLSGHLFVFFNRRMDRMKVLWWDRNGYALYSKRLETGRFSFQKVGQEANPNAIRITGAELLLIMEGIDLSSAGKRRRYIRKSLEIPA